MNDSEVRTLEQVKKILKAVKRLKFKGLSRKEKYTWLNDIIRRFVIIRSRRKTKACCADI